MTNEKQPNVDVDCLPNTGGVMAEAGPHPTLREWLRMNTPIWITELFSNND